MSFQRQTINYRKLTIVALLIAIIALATAFATVFLSSRVQQKAGNPEFEFLRAGVFTFTTSLGVQAYGPFTVTFSALPGAATDVKLTTVGGTATSPIGGAAFTFLAVQGSTTEGTWVGMPAAKTELFSPSGTSTACCRVYGSLLGEANGCTFAVDTITPSSTVGATLSVQWANTNTGPWHDIAGSSVDIHTTAPNPKTAFFSVAISGLGSNVFLRVVGTGGGGVGDNPQFATLGMSCSAISAGIALGWLSPTATSFLLFVTLSAPDPTGGNPIEISYLAIDCPLGGGNC